MKTIELTIEYDNEDVEAVIGYEEYPSYRGYRDSFGVPLEPDEDGYIDIVSVLVNGVDVIDNLTDKELRDINDKIIEDLTSYYEDEDYRKLMRKMPHL